MNLSAHVTLDEFIASDTAARQHINNDLPAEMLTTARATAEMIERIRKQLSILAARDVPIIITSGYRCIELNRAIGSSDGSDHVRAMAADIRAPLFGDPLSVCRALVPLLSIIGIGQIIWEFGSWCHVSSRPPGNPVNRVLTIDARGTRAGLG